MMNAIASQTCSARLTVPTISLLPVSITLPSHLAQCISASTEWRLSLCGAVAARAATTAEDNPVVLKGCTGYRSFGVDRERENAGQPSMLSIRLVPLLPRSTHVPRQDVPAHTGESTQACTRVNARRRPPSFWGVSSAPACLLCLALHLSSAILSSRLARCVVVYRRRGCLTLADTPRTHTRGGFVYFSTPRTRKGLKIIEKQQQPHQHQHQQHRQELRASFRY
ncbi:hypothetical protein Q4I30_003012 [Leishmania utingensis]|uniref:Uncharacterized protein n=1 Tax=Leishmania utingensis TaxID=653362 RepID=A0AAW3ALP9_9TRYP